MLAGKSYVKDHWSEAMSTCHITFVVVCTCSERLKQDLEVNAVQIGLHKCITFRNTILTNSSESWPCGTIYPPTWSEWRNKSKLQELQFQYIIGLHIACNLRTTKLHRQWLLLVQNNLRGTITLTRGFKVYINWRGKVVEPNMRRYIKRSNVLKKSHKSCDTLKSFTKCFWK